MRERGLVVVAYSRSTYCNNSRADERRPQASSGTKKAKATEVERNEPTARRHALALFPITVGHSPRRCLCEARRIEVTSSLLGGALCLLVRSQTPGGNALCLKQSTGTGESCVTPPWRQRIPMSC